VPENIRLERLCLRFCGKVHKKLKAFPDYKGELASWRSFKNSYIKTGEGGIRYCDFNGILLALQSGSIQYYYLMSDVLAIFVDTFLFPTFLKDDYSRELVEKIEPSMTEGPYGYTDGEFDVTVKKEDIVIDAGSMIGDFSVYAAAKGALCYAFEPVGENYDLLEKTIALNKTERVIPVKKGLAAKEGEADFSISQGSSTMVMNHTANTERVSLITLDAFVAEQKLPRVDFIKADIEGAERDMLAGAKKTLREHAPKLAICTYHLPDDPEVLTRIIKEANPNYKIVRLRKKLYACV
jgi:FkbM family methyltransferase